MLPTRIRRASRPVWPSPFSALEDEFDRFVGRWISDDNTTTGAYPVDIHEDENHVFVDAELPGFNKKDVGVTYENGVLSIIAERKDKDQKKGQTHLAERRYNRVARSFTLPNTVDEDKVDAKLTNGVLYLTLSKRDEVKPHRIEVN